MARSGIYKSEVLRARDALLAMGRHPSIDAVREELGHTGSKSTIHRFLKEIEEEEGPRPHPQVAISEALQELVGRLASRLNEEAETRVTQAQHAHALEIGQHLQQTQSLQSELSELRQKLQHTDKALAQEKAQHAQALETLNGKNLECAQLTQQVTDLQSRVVAEEKHRESLEEKHQHARQALEHFRESSRVQREQDQRRHEQQVQFLQTELRSVNETLVGKQQALVQAHQDLARLAADLLRSQSDGQKLEEELIGLRPLPDALQQLQRRAESLEGRLEAMTTAHQQTQAAETAVRQENLALNAQLQQSELALAKAQSALAAQEQTVAHMLDRWVASLASARPQATAEPDNKPDTTANTPPADPAP